jgi:hypothetical protein
MLGQGPVQAPGAQPGQIGDGGAGAGQDDEVGVGEVARAGGEDHIEAGFQTQGVDIGEVADPGKPDNGDLAGVDAARPAALEVERVLGVQPQRGVPGQHTVHPAPGEPFHGIDARCEQ